MVPRVLRLALLKQGLRYCTRCVTIRPLEMFGKGQGSKNTLSGSRNCCKLCDKDDRLKQRFGISLKEYEAVLSSQGGKCAICKQPDPRQSLAVDHTIEEGVKKLRGLLCENCNRAIGLFKESTEIMKEAIRYLELHNGQ